MLAYSWSTVRPKDVSPSEADISPCSLDIHFQYNGVLFGIFILSIGLMVDNKPRWSAFTFAGLLNFKHIFLYVAPVYFVFLLASYCFPETEKNGKRQRRFNFFRFIAIGIIVGVVFIISLGPFVAMGQLLQLKDRLFPFKRGLVHAYWAPNFWAMYVAFDRFLHAVSPGLTTGADNAAASATSGLVGVGSFSVLPSIPPVATFALTAVTMMPALYCLWNRPTPKNFIASLVHCGMSSFMFGWHVHEKAILLAIIPLGLIAAEDGFQRRTYLLMATIGHFGLFPLLFLPTETPIKILLLASHTTLAAVVLRASWTHFSWLELLAFFGLVPLLVVHSILHPFVLGFTDRFPFLHVLLISVYCAFVLFFLYIRYALDIWRTASQKRKVD